MAITTNGAPEVTATNAVTLTNKTLTAPTISDPTFTGTTTNINTTNLVVEDKNIVINDVTSPSDTNADGGGISLNGSTTKSLNWVDATDAWTSSEHLNLASGKSYYANGTLLKDVSETLTNKTISLGSNTISSTLAQLNTAVSDADVVSLAGSETLTNKTLTAPTVNDATSNYPTIKAPTETANIVAAAATGTINIDVETSTIWYYTTNASANHTLNFRYNSGTSLSSKLAVGETITIVWITPNGGTAYYPNVINIDGSAVTPKVQGGTAISAGNASATDIYSFTIMKTAATPTYLVLESQTKFA